MSKRDSDDLDMPGYFLPEDSQLRLAKLSDHIKFLARLAQPRTYAEREWALEVPAGELAICLESLAEQADRVLEAMSWSAPQQFATDAVERGTMPPTAAGASDTADERFAFGITLDQIDALDRLIQTISAHGDVVAAGRTAELANHTQLLMGQAIYDAAVAVRAILDQVEAQRLGQGSRPRTGVGEERGIYAASRTRVRVDFLDRLREKLHSDPCSRGPLFPRTGPPRNPRHRRRAAGAERGRGLTTGWVGAANPATRA